MICISVGSASVQLMKYCLDWHAREPLAATHFKNMDWFRMARERMKSRHYVAKGVLFAAPGNGTRSNILGCQMTLVNPQKVNVCSGSEGDNRPQS